MEFRDATAMAEAVRKKNVSAEELVKDSIARIEKLNPLFNAVVDKQYDEALETSRLSQFIGKPFGGVPILLKDLGQNQAGHLSTSGSRLFASSHAFQTDRFVEKIENLGFIVLGRTNTPEFGFKNISDSSLHGPVNLPRDVKRNAGGSSGGAAVAVASGMVPLATASDGGGSIRIPASFNGLIGLKPSRGRMPVGPSSYRSWQGASVHFALTKSIRDTKNLLFGMQECQLESPFPMPLLSAESLFSAAEKPLKIAYTLASPIATPISKEVEQAVLEAVDVLKELGHEVVELSQFPLDGAAVTRAYYLMNSVETAQMFDEIEQGMGRSMTPDDMELMTWAIYQSGQKIPAKQYSKTLQEWDQYSAQMACFHEEFDLLLTPTVADVAPLHHQFSLTPQFQSKLLHMAEHSTTEQQELIWEMFEKSLSWTPFTLFANLTGQPAISLPTYETKDGLPIGIQLVAAKGREDILLAVSGQFERLEYLKI